MGRTTRETPCSYACTVFARPNRTVWNSFGIPFGNSQATVIRFTSEAHNKLIRAVDDYRPVVALTRWMDGGYPNNGRAE